METIGWLRVRELAALGPGKALLSSCIAALRVAQNLLVPVVSIVVPLFGLTSFVLRILKVAPKRNYNGDYG